MSACRSCGARIVWAKTSTGKAIPVDADPVEHGNIVLSSGGVAEVGPAGSGTHVSHFATCPERDEWRKR